MDPVRIRNELQVLPPATFASKYLFESVPHVFAEDMDQYVTWKGELGELIEVDPRAIAIIGSAGVGISLSPRKGLRPFGPRSDIDVAVVSFHHFDLAWRSLRSMTTAERFGLSKPQRASTKEHERRFIYWGTVAADRLLELLPFKKTWIEAFSHMAGVPPTSERKINARIYRDFDSLRAYQMRSVEQARADLEERTRGDA